MSFTIASTLAILLVTVGVSVIQWRRRGALVGVVSGLGTFVTLIIAWSILVSLLLSRMG